MFFILTASAFAQVRGETQQVIVPAVTEVDFQELDVNARGDRPDLVLIDDVTHNGHPSMIRLRGSFQDKMSESVDELR